MFRSEEYSDLLWDLLDQCHGSAEELRRLLSDEPQEVIRTFHEEFREAEQNLWSSSIENILRASEVSCDQMGDIFTAVIGRGRRYYDEIVDDPDRIPRSVPSADVAIGGVAGSVYWERFRLEIGIPDDEQTPRYGVPVSLVVPVRGESLSEEERAAQSAILADLESSGFEKRLISFSVGATNMRFDYLIEYLPAFQSVCVSVVGKHLPGRTCQVTLREETDQTSSTDKAGRTKRCS